MAIFDSSIQIMLSFVACAEFLMFLQLALQLSPLMFQESIGSQSTRISKSVNVVSRSKDQISFLMHVANFRIAGSLLAIISSHN